MPSFYSEAQVQAMRRTHVGKMHFIEVQLPSGAVNYHDGVGEVTVGGKTWQGVSNPFGEGQVASVGKYESPRLNTLPKVSIAMLSADVEFIKGIRALGTGFYGLPAKLYRGIFDGENGGIIGDLILVFDGHLSKYDYSRKERVITFDIDGPLQAINSPQGVTWNAAQQQQRFAGDLGLNFMGVEKIERIT